MKDRIEATRVKASARDRRDWLDAIKVGDEVAVIESGALSYITTVTHRTKQFVRTPECDYSARTGKSLRDGPRTPPPTCICPATDDHRSQLRSSVLAYEIKGRTSRFTAMPTLEAMRALLEWQQRPHVATHVLEEIERVTREESRR